jgi:hypothetical protein
MSKPRTFTEDAAGLIGAYSVKVSDASVLAIGRVNERLAVDCATVTFAVQIWMVSLAMNLFGRSITIWTNAPVAFPEEAWENRERGAIVMKGEVGRSGKKSGHAGDRTLCILR